MKLELTPEQVTKLRSVLHYNGLPIDARSVTDDVLAQEGYEVAKKTTVRMSARDQRAENNQSHAYTNQSQSDRLRAANLQGWQDDAVRRLRPQRDFGTHHRRVLTRWASIRSR